MPIPAKPNIRRAKLPGSGTETISGGGLHSYWSILGSQARAWVVDANPNVKTSAKIVFMLKPLFI